MSSKKGATKNHNVSGVSAIETMQVLFAYNERTGMPTEAFVTKEKVDRMLLAGGIARAHRVNDNLSWGHLSFAEHARHYMEEFGPLKGDGTRMVVHTIKGDGNCNWIRVGPPVRTDSVNGMGHAGWRLVWGALQKEMNPKQVAIVCVTMQYPMRCKLVEVPYKGDLSCDPVHLTRLIPGYYVLLGELKNQCARLTEEKMARLLTRCELQKLSFEQTTCDKSMFMRDVMTGSNKGNRLKGIPGINVGSPTLVNGIGGMWALWGPMDKTTMDQADELETWDETYKHTKALRNCPMGFIAFWVSDEGVSHLNFHSTDAPGCYGGMSEPRPSTFSQAVRVNNKNGYGIGREDYLEKEDQPPPTSKPPPTSRESLDIQARKRKIG